MIKKGMILICTLSIMVVLSIFLMTAVYQMQSSTMVTKKAMWDIKSYWSAIAGSTIASDGCIRDYRWPEEGLLEQAVGYTIKKENNIVTAEDESSSSTVTIYHKSKLLNNTGHESPAPSEEILNNHFTKVELNTSTTEEEKGEIYCLSVGKSGPTVVGLELIYGLYYNPNLFNKAIGNKDITQDEMDKEASISATGAIYVKGDLTANLKEFFTVSQVNGTRGYIVVGGNVDINNVWDNKYPPNPDISGCVKIAEGAIFMGGNVIDQTQKICKINGTKIEPDNNTNISKYGIAVYTSPKVEIKHPTFNILNNPVSFPAGMFCFVEMPQQYDVAEFDEATNTLFNVSLKPQDFYTIYAEPLLNANPNYEPDNDPIITTTRATFSEKFSESYLDRFDIHFDNKFNSLFASATQEVKKIKPLHKCYLLEQCSKILSEYKKDNSVYESYFIPNGVAGINDNVDNEIDLKYKMFAKARVLGNIAKQINSNGSSYSSEFLTNLYSSNNVNTATIAPASTEYGENYIKKYFREYRQENINTNINSDNEAYIAEEVGTTNKCFVLNKISEYDIDSTAQYKSQQSQQIANILPNVIFESNNEDLIMSVNCNLKSEINSFKFATFERKDNVIAEMSGFGQMNQMNMMSNEQLLDSTPSYDPRNSQTPTSTPTASPTRTGGGGGGGRVKEEEARETNEMTLNNTTKNQRLASNYIVKQSIPVETMANFLKIFVTPVIAEEVRGPQQYTNEVNTEIVEGGGGGGGGSTGGGGGSTGGGGSVVQPTQSQTIIPDPDYTEEPTLATPTPNPSPSPTPSSSTYPTVPTETPTPEHTVTPSERYTPNINLPPAFVEQSVSREVIVQRMLNENPDSNYISALNRRAAVRLGTPQLSTTTVNNTATTTENSITAKNINIKGFIYGTGHICSTNGDIIFEAVGSGVDAREENWVSIWSSNDIIINRVSAIYSTSSGATADLSTSDFRGILFSQRDLTVDVGTDNLNFTVSGAIICGRNMDMIGIRNLIVNYDPSLSSLILDRFINDWNTGTQYIEQKLNENSNTQKDVINTGKFKMFNRI